MLEKPDWIRARVKPGSMESVSSKVCGLATVCEEASCPNINECWSRKHATFMILGRTCSRNCKFCNVTTGKPDPIDPAEPEKIATAVKELGLRHVVITSVTRDDLADGGASQFAKVIHAMREIAIGTSIELLTPDFMHKNNAEDIIIEKKPEIFGHNIETVPSVYKKVRPSGSYEKSLDLLNRVKFIDKEIFTKSAIMVGLGETMDEIESVMDDLRTAHVDFITIGQYLQPSNDHYPVKRYVHPIEYDAMKAIAYKKGFSVVCAFPLARSSYMAEEEFEKYIGSRKL